MTIHKNLARILATTAAAWGMASTPKAPPQPLPAAAPLRGFAWSC